MTVAILVAGQDYAPLLPPITHDGHLVNRVLLSPDGQTLLTIGDDFTARLWNTRTAGPIAVLRKGDERVVNCGFSPDGRTAFTDDQASIARLWDVPGGRFRAATERRPNRYGNQESPGGDGVWNDYVNGDQWDSSALSGSRLLTRRIIQRGLPGGRVRPGLNNGLWRTTVSCEGPVELWDVETGRLVVRVDRPDRAYSQVQFLNGGRWVTAVEGGSAVRIFSAEDGQLLATLEHKSEKVLKVFASPTGRRIATVCEGQAGKSRTLRFWDTGTWRAEPASIDGIDVISPDYQFVTEDLIALYQSGLGIADWFVYQRGEARPSRSRTSTASGPISSTRTNWP